MEKLAKLCRSVYHEMGEQLALILEVKKQYWGSHFVCMELNSGERSYMTSGMKFRSVSS